VKSSPKPGPDAPFSVAVVVPTLNEGDRIGPLLDGLAAFGFAEIVVADGGSEDGTAAIAREKGVLVVVGPRGRGPQQNLGARACRSDAVLFLHADSLPPPDVVPRIQAALGSADVVGGAFRTRFDAEHPVLALYAWAGRFETPLTTFGDQGLFMRRAAYEAAGGFPDWPFLEDVEMRRRLKRLGRFVKLRAEVRTSARRYFDEGLVRRQALNLAVLLRFWAGDDPERLARFYRAHAARRR
jgi:rSAM/selenodomain-associated transferase 2